MSILSGPRIEQMVKEGWIEIDPFDRTRVNPASIDLTLGREVAVYERWSLYLSVDGQLRSPDSCLSASDEEMDVKEEPKVLRYAMGDGGLLLRPGILYLMHTAERVKTNEFVPVLDGKSSIGRLGIVIHLTAGYGDPGFDGQYTLEVTAVHPVRVYAGMRFCQMRFHELSGPQLNYQETGNYQGDDAHGPVPSKAFKQFR
jgi:dCTP deaminase